ncbi:hypothetical protein NFJ02_26g61670 [Pycnococcus provasolii]
MMATTFTSKVPAVVLVVMLLESGVNAKPYGGNSVFQFKYDGGNGGYYGKYGGSKYGGVSDSYGKYGGVSDSYDDGYYKGSKYGGYGYNAPKPKVSWWKPWSWKYAKKSYSYSYGDEYEYGHDNDLTKADLAEAAHAYVGLSETLNVDVFRALPMTPATTTTTTLTTTGTTLTTTLTTTFRTTNASFVLETTTTAIPKQDPNEFECTCGYNVGNLAFACISFLFDKDGNEIPVDPNDSASAIQSVYQPVGFRPSFGLQLALQNLFQGQSLAELAEFIATVQQIQRTLIDIIDFPADGGDFQCDSCIGTTRRQGSILPHNPGGERITMTTSTSYDYSVELQGLVVAFEGTRGQTQSEVTCRGPQAVIEACAARCDRAVEEKLLTKNEFAQKCLP